MFEFVAGDLVRFKIRDPNYRFLNLDCTSTYIDTQELSTILYLSFLTERESTCLLMLKNGVWLQGFVFTRYLEAC